MSILCAPLIKKKKNPFCSLNYFNPISPHPWTFLCVLLKYVGLLIREDVLNLHKWHFTTELIYFTFFTEHWLLETCSCRCVNMRSLAVVPVSLLYLLGSIPSPSEGHLGCIHPCYLQHDDEHPHNAPLWIHVGFSWNIYPGVQFLNHGVYRLP